jgi:D-alanyl-D-alanine carboxypeptidase
VNPSRRQQDLGAGNTWLEKRNSVLAAVIWLLALLAGCDETGERLDASWNATYLTDTIAKTLRQTAIPGAIVGVWQDGEPPYLKAFGVRDNVTGEPMTPDMHMRIGSDTKTFTVTAVLQLVDQGRIALDDPIAKHLPGVPNGDRITIRQLAAMRSVCRPTPTKSSRFSGTIRTASGHPRNFWRSLSYIHRDSCPESSMTTPTPTRSCWAS